MLKRTLTALAFVLAVSSFNSSPASAFGWCGWGYRAYSSPLAYSYAPRTYYRPRAWFYRPAYRYRPVVAGAFYRPGIRVYRRAAYRPFVGRAFYRPGVRVYRRAAYRPFVGRADYRPRATRAFYRSDIRVSGPRARAFDRPGVRASFRPAGRAYRPGRLP